MSRLNRTGGENGRRRAQTNAGREMQGRVPEIEVHQFLEEGIEHVGVLEKCCVPNRLLMPSRGAKSEWRCAGPEPTQCFLS
jgi:hypothetical protein